MAEVKPLVILARNVKQKALERALRILEHPEDYSSELYNETYLTVLKNAVPRSTEITGEDGEAIKLAFDPVFNQQPNASQPASETTGDSPQSESVQDSPSGA